jgi:hypothetical protein
MAAIIECRTSLLDEIRELIKKENLPSRDEFNANYQTLQLATLTPSSTTDPNRFETYFSSTNVAETQEVQTKNKRAIRKYYEISFDSDSESEAEVVSSSQESATTDKESVSDTNPLPAIPTDIRIGDFYFYILNTKIKIFTDTLQAEDLLNFVDSSHPEKQRIKLLGQLLQPEQDKLKVKHGEILNAFLSANSDITHLDNEITKLKMNIALVSIYILLMITPKDSNETIAFYMNLLKKYSDTHFSKATRGGNKPKKTRKSRRRLKQKHSRKSTRARSRSRKQKRTRKLTRK